jgi:Hypothetical glycosyl hydrolase family 15
MVAAAGAALPAVGLRGPSQRTTARSAQPAAVTNALKRWAATNGGGDAAQTVTQAQAVADATNYDLLVAQRKTFPPYLGPMRAANPDLKIVAYLNGTYAQSNQGTAYPDAWYVRAADGSKVQSKKFGNYLMDPTNQGWIQNRVQTCATYAAQSGYDGCYLDMLGNATVGAGYDTAAPINPATHTVWTRSQWIGATSKLGTSVQSANPALLVVGNGLANGTQFFDPQSGPTSTLLNGIPAANAQGFVRNENDALTNFRSTAAWKRDVAMLVSAGTRTRSVMAMAKVGKPATPSQLQQVHRYALATFLLGTDGNQYFYFSPNGNEDGVNAPDTPDDHVNPGLPAGPYVAKANGAYVRPFSAGYVAVNPTDATVQVNLGATYVDLDGQSGQQATLEPHTGMVFTTTAPGANRQPVLAPSVV